MRTDILAKIIEDAGLGVRATNIFIHQMPPECKRGILIKPPLTGIEINHYLPGYYTGEVQIIIRANENLDGEDLARKVTAALTHKQTKDYKDPLNSTNFAMRINFLLPKSLPIRYPRSDGNGIEWSINFFSSYVMA